MKASILQIEFGAKKRACKDLIVNIISGLHPNFIPVSEDEEKARIRTLLEEVKVVIKHYEENYL
jgi:hypothetical protein